MITDTSKVLKLMARGAKLVYMFEYEAFFLSCNEVSASTVQALEETGEIVRLAAEGDAFTTGGKITFALVV